MNLTHDRSDLQASIQSLERMVQRLEEMFPSVKPTASAAPTPASSANSTPPTTMSIFDDELVYAAFVKRDVERRRQELDELWSAYPNKRQGLEPFTITSVGTAAPSPAPVTSLDSSAPPTTPPPLTPIATTSSDINLLISTPTVEPLEPVQAAPARCSTEGRSHDEQDQVLVVAAPTSAPIPLQDVQPLQDGMTAITSKPSPTCIHAQVVFDDMQQKSNTSRSYYFEDSQQRYIHSCKPAYSNDVVFPCLATRMLDVQKWCQGMGAQKLVMLQTVSATLVDKGPRTYISHFETVDISPKPPWSRVCLEADSAKGSFDPQKCFKFCLWFTCGWVIEQLRSPWPPPTQPQLQSVDSQLRPTLVNLFTAVHPEKPLFGIGNIFRCYSVAWKLDMQIKFSSVSLLLGNQEHISLLCAMPVRNQFLHGLDFLVATGQSFFQDFGLHTTELLLKNLLSVLWCCHRGVHCQVLLPFQVYIYMQWDICWPVPMVGHHKKAKLDILTVTCTQSLSQFTYPSQVSNDEGLLMQSPLKRLELSDMISVQEIMAPIIVDHMAGQRRCDGALLLNKDQVQKQLPITKAEQLSTTTLGSSHEAIQGHISTLDIFVQLHNDCDYFMAVKGEISLLLLLTHSASKYTTTCEFNMQCCKQHSESLENAVRVAGSWQSFQGTIIGALALFTLIQKPWQLLYIYRSNVVFQLSVPHQVVCCKVCSPPILVCMADNGITRTTVLFNRQVLLHCYQYKVQDVLQWSAYEDAVTYVHVASIRIPPSQAGTFVGHYFWLTQICTSTWCAWCNEKVIQREDHSTTPILKLSTTWGCSSHSRADIAQFFRLYSKPPRCIFEILWFKLLCQRENQRAILESLLLDPTLNIHNWQFWRTIIEIPSFCATRAVKLAILIGANCPSGGLYGVLIKASSVVTEMVICYSAEFSNSNNQKDKCEIATVTGLPTKLCNTWQMFIHMLWAFSYWFLAGIKRNKLLSNWDPMSEKQILISAYNPGNSNSLTGNSEWCADGIIEKCLTGCSTTCDFLLLSDVDHEARTLWQHAMALLQSNFQALHGESLDTLFTLPKVAIIHLGEY